MFVQLRITYRMRKCGYTLYAAKGALIATYETVTQFGPQMEIRDREPTHYKNRLSVALRFAH